MSLRAFVRTLLVAVLGLHMVAASPALAQEKKKNAPKAALIGIDAVIEERASQTVPVIGRLVAQRSGVVSVLSKGVVAEVLVRVGDRVQAGDVMARLLANSLTWSRELRAAEVDSAKASLANARTQASLRRQELKRLDNLKKSAAFSAARYEDAQKELAKAESDAARAEAELARNIANLNLAQIDLDNAEIKAPYPGVVSAVHTEVGTYLNTGQPVVTLVDDSTMEIEADVPANRTAGLVAGTQVTFTTGGGPQQQATVRAVVPDENPLTRTRAVRFAPDANAILEGAASNQTVAISIPAGPARIVVTVHKDAVLNRNGRQVVFLMKDGKAELRPVTLDEAVLGRFIVISGLTPGDKVVVRGNERLAPGQEIRAEASADAAKVSNDQ
ncbi:efflux RND transporter periplasmic adaptor subunit [Magnetovibrio sp.]|uniref:efflux RND transporter periplasmic adaptor subunit n=1 Tax=Magnetovibrio sp. TaxID=2024836 RepID=UPI002F95BFC4